MTKGTRKTGGKNAGSKGKQLNLSSEAAVKASGSQSESFQAELLDQVILSLWLPEWKNEDAKVRSARAAYDAMQKMAPRSELEGMLAGQMIGTHNAAMECLRRAMMEGQGFESRNANLNHAAKLMGLYERQLAALDKHRGKGQQKITVEHVTVEAGGQAIVGNVRASAPPPNRSGASPPALSHSSENGVPLPEPLTSPARAKQRVRKNSK